MANITRIKASTSGKSPEKATKPSPSGNTPKPPKDGSKDKKSVRKAARAEKRALKATKRQNKAQKTQKPMPKWLKIISWPFRTIAKPFAALGHYIGESWTEIRQVRWPSRKATWKMVLAIFVYTIIIGLIITLLDALFTWLFNLVLGK